MIAKGVVAAALLWIASLLPLASAEPLRARVALSIGCGLVATIAYAALVYLAFRGRGRMVIYVAIGLVGRALLLLPDEGLSDDLYRYLWEGRLVVAGENPYLKPPQDPSLAWLRDERVWPRVTHPEVPAAYPPVSQAFFAAVVYLGGGPRGLRVALTLVDLIAWALLARLLSSRGLDARRSVVWGLSPLVVIEIAGSGHFDVLAVAASLWALLLASAGRPRWSAVALGLATVCKPYAPLLLPFLLVRRHAASQLICFALVIVAAYAPFARDGNPLAGIARYSEFWTHNAPLFPSVREAAQDFKEYASRGLERLGASQGVRDLAYDIDPNRLARAALLIVLALIVAWLWTRRIALEVKSLWALVWFLLLAATVHPWYVLWFIPLLALRCEAPLLLWSGTVLLSYELLPRYDATGVWQESGLVRALEYAPWMIWWAWRSVRRRLGQGVEQA